MTKTHENLLKFSDFNFPLQPTFDNKEVAETLIESVDTTTMTKFIDGLLKFKTRYAYTKTATKGTSMFLLVHLEIKFNTQFVLCLEILSIQQLLV